MVNTVPGQATLLLFEIVSVCTPVPTSRVPVVLKANVPIVSLNPTPVPVLRVPPPSDTALLSGKTLAALIVIVPPVMFVAPE